MNGKDLLKSMTAIDESLIKEAENYTTHKSERGGITMKQQNQDFQETSEMEQNTNKINMYRHILTAAACLLLCAGLIGGSIHSLQQRRNLAEMPSAEITETEPETIQTETKINQPASFIAETKSETKASDSAETKQTTITEINKSIVTEIQPETTVTTPETQKIQETTVQSVTETVITIQEESAPAEEIPQISIQEIQQEIAQEFAQEVQETSAPETETEIIQETEPVQEWAEIQLEPAPLDERGLPVISGFTLKYLWPSEENFDITPEGFPEIAPELRTFPRFPTNEIRFDLNYTSANLLFGDENASCSNDDNRRMMFAKSFYSEDETIKFCIVMCVMTSDVNFLLPDNSQNELAYDNLTFYPVSVNGNYGYFKVNGNGSIVNLTWYQDGYSFFIFENYPVTNPYEEACIPFEYAGELLKMAESVQISE